VLPVQSNALSDTAGPRPRAHLKGGGMNAEAEELCHALTQGRITRRVFVQRGVALGLSLTAVGTLLSACGSGGETTGSPAASASMAPVKGGTLKVGVIAPGTALNPSITIDSGSVSTMNQVLEHLVWVDHERKIYPKLAVSWDSNGSDLSEWIFKLRDGVKWHDGKPFTADDVAWTFNYITDPKLGSNALSMLGGVLSKGGTAARDAGTVVFSLDRPVADFPYYVCEMMWNSMIIQANSDPGKWEKNPIGTGPFTLDTFVPQESATLSRNPNYWDTGKPYLDSVQFTYYAEIPPQVMALQSGELDMMVETTYGAGRSLFNDSSLKTTWSNAAEPRCLNMKVDHPPFTDKRVRQALALSLDRNAIVEALYSGYADIANDHAFAPLWGFNITVPQRTQDYAQAKQLLADAGLADGFSHTLQSMNYLEFPQYLTIVKKMASDASINVDLDLMTMAEFYGTGNNMPWLETPFGCVDWATRGTASQLILPAFYGKSDWNSANWKNDEYDKLLKKLDATPLADAAGRDEIANRMAEIQNDEVPWIIAYWPKQARPMKQNVQGIPINPTMQTDLSGAFLST
jgi:peptide/nickel transport system substrate-binding protein